VKPRPQFSIRQWLLADHDDDERRYHRRWCDVFACDVYAAVFGKPCEEVVDHRLDNALPFVPVTRLLELAIRWYGVPLRDTSPLRLARSPLRGRSL